MIKGVLVTTNGEIKAVEFEPELHKYYELLECDCIDITQRKVGGVFYDIICDDEGLLKDRPIPTAFNGYGEPQLVGNLLFVRHDGEGNEATLTEEDIENIMSNTGSIIIQRSEDEDDIDFNAVVILDGKDGVN